jgi:hypothetical protein
MSAIEFVDFKFPWYRRAWFWLRNWRPRRVMRSYVIIEEETIDENEG